MMKFIEKLRKTSVSRRRLLRLAVLLALVAPLLYANAFGQTAVRKYAVIGDFGSDDDHELDVSRLIKSWNPELILTVGDNNYPDGEASTMDRNIGKYFHEFIYPYTGTYGAGATVNRFFPSLGNHDWDNRAGAPAQPYKDYFTLPGNERYYDFVAGDVHFFAIDSDDREPDGNTSNSVQAVWLRNRLAASTAKWKIVYFHHPPYSSRTSDTDMRWPFQEWGATAVITGHAHVYERVMRNGFPYMTNGLGGESTGTFGTPIAGSVVRFGNDYGAQLITANSEFITFQFITQAGLVIDTFTISTQPLGAPINLTATSSSGTQVNLLWTDTANNEDGFRIERCQNAGCTNFAEIAQVGTNVTTYSDGGRAPETTYVYRLRAFNSGGASGYSNTAQVTTAPFGTAVFSDDFNDGVRDPAKWSVGIFSRSSSVFDPQVQVAEQNGRLSITPRAAYSTSSYGGYLSSTARDFSDHSAVVEVVQKTSGNAVTIFSVGIDKDNWYGFRAKGSTLYFEYRRLGATTSVTVSYSALQHRFWRLRVDAATNAVVFETSPDSMNWTARRSVAREFALTSALIELIAGTGEAVSAPDVALFDNFRLESNSAASPPPSAPSNLAAAPGSTSEIDLTWTDNADTELGYKIERCQDADCLNFSQIAQVGANQTSFSDLGLSAITTYRYRVRAFNNGADSGYSNIAEAATPAPPPSAPAAPSNLVANGVSTTQIDLHWSVNSANEDGFRIERCQNAGCTNFAEIAQVGIDVDAYSDAGLTSDTIYAYRVRAFNALGNSDYSNVAEAPTQSSLPPAAPGDLAGAAFSTTRIDLGWTDNANNENGFRIERCQDAGCTSFVQIAEVGMNITAYSDQGLAAATAYRYRVRAFSVGGGNSDYSNVAEISTPSPPASVFSDDFNDGVRDPAKWDLGILSRNASNFDTLVVVAEQNGQLSITPRASVNGNSYSGYVSAAGWSLQNSRTSVQVLQKASGNAATIFSVGTDKNNWYGFRAKGSSLFLESRINSATTEVILTYDAVQHRFWRLRHDAAADTIVFETSPDNANWTARRSVARQLSLAAVQIELIAGTTGSVPAPGAAVFDNFTLGSN
jgi:tartrate-resistant acid phosphatase type 5